MSWQWTRSAGTLTSSCTLCATTITGRRDNDVTFAQRGHDAFTCQLQRAQTARAAQEPEPDVDTCPDGHEREEDTYVDKHGHLVCNACRRERYAELRQEKEAS